MKLTILISIVLASLVLAAPLAAAEATSAVEVTFSDITKARFLLTQNWEGTKASEFRTDLERTFGNRDGNLNQTEIDTIMTATKRDFENAWQPRIQLDGQWAHITGADIQQTGLIGPVSSTAPVRLTHDLQLEFNRTGSTSPAFNTTLAVGSFARVGDFKLTTPSGWSVKTAEGFVINPAGGGSTAQGRVEFASNVRVTFQEAPQQTGNGGGGIPGPGLLGVLLAAGAVAALTRWRRAA